MSDYLRDYHLKRLFSVQVVDENVYDMRSLFRLEKTVVESVSLLDGLSSLFTAEEKHDIEVVEWDFINYRIVDEEDGFLLVQTCARDEKRLECTRSESVTIIAETQSLNLSLRNDTVADEHFYCIRQLFIERRLEGDIFDGGDLYIRQLFMSATKQQYGDDCFKKSFGLGWLFKEENFYEDRFVLFRLNHLFGRRDHFVAEEVWDDLNLNFIYKEGI